MKFRDAIYVAGGYVVDNGRVLLLWHAALNRWVPAGGRIEVAAGEYPHEAVIREVAEEVGLEVEVTPASSKAIADSAVSPLPMPASVQEIILPSEERYFDFVYFCRVVGGTLNLDYREARAYRWFSRDDLQRFPLLPHVAAYGAQSLES